MEDTSNLESYILEIEELLEKGRLNLSEKEHIRLSQLGYMVGDNFSESSALRLATIERDMPVSFLFGR